MDPKNLAFASEGYQKSSFRLRRNLSNFLSGFGGILEAIWHTWSSFNPLGTLLGSLGLFRVVLGGAWRASGGPRRASGGPSGRHLGVIWSPLGALWVDLEADLELICIEICVKSYRATAKSEFGGNAESFALIERNQGFEL